MDRLIVCLGDSVTAAGWPAALERMLRRAGAEGVRVVNAGVRGNTSGQGLRRLERDVLSLRPWLVLVQFGFNDCNVVLNGPRPRVSLTRFRENLTAIVGRIRESGAEPVLIVNYHTLMQRVLPDGRPYEEQNREYSEAMSVLASAMGTRSIDLRDLFPGPGIELSAALAEDGIHLSPVGVEAYARILGAFLAA